MNRISKQLTREAFASVYSDTKKVTVAGMRFVLKMYSELTTEVRSELLLVYIAMLLQIIQTGVDQ